MSELKNRLISSIVMILFLFLAYYNVYILTFLLIFIFFQIFDEFHYIFKRIYPNKDKLQLYFMLLIILCYVSFLIILSWIYLIELASYENILFYLIIITCVCTDIGGFVFGKIFKGKKLTRISPNKTYSGMIGSYILSLIIVYIIFNKYISLEKVILFAFITSTFSQCGDLLISFLKRKAKIKNTGNIIPGHGGILDRLDGIIFAVPLVIILNNFL